MTVKIEKTTDYYAYRHIDDAIRKREYYIIKYRFHWWQRWRTIRNPNHPIPMLFDTPKDANNKLNELGFEIK